MKFIKGEIVCSSVDSRYIGVFERIDEDDNFMSCFIDPENEVNNRQGNFYRFQKATKEQKNHFKQVLLNNGYSYYKGKVIHEL